MSRLSLKSNLIKFDVNLEDSKSTLVYIQVIKINLIENIWKLIELHGLKDAILFFFYYLQQFVPSILKQKFLTLGLVPVPVSCLTLLTKFQEFYSKFQCNVSNVGLFDLQTIKQCCNAHVKNCLEIGFFETHKYYINLSNTNF